MVWLGWEGEWLCQAESTWPSTHTSRSTDVWRVTGVASLSLASIYWAPLLLSSDSILVPSFCFWFVLCSSACTDHAVWLWLTDSDGPKGPRTTKDLVLLRSTKDKGRDTQGAPVKLADCAAWVFGRTVELAGCQVLACRVHILHRRARNSPIHHAPRATHLAPRTARHITVICTVR